MPRAAIRRMIGPGRGDTLGVSAGRGGITLPAIFSERPVMFRAFLPDVCPSCGEDVPRAAALRCPFCRISFLQPPPAPSSARAQQGDPDDEG